jgi:hypothetical protein
VDFEPKAATSNHLSLTASLRSDPGRLPPELVAGFVGIGSEEGLLTQERIDLLMSWQANTGFLVHMR